jgi:hypothetical protein
VVRELLTETQAGLHSSDKAEVKKVLTECYNAYLQFGYLPFAGKVAIIDTYSHANMAGKFAALLNH